MSDFPYADRFPVNRRLPEHGRSRDEVLEELSVMAREEDAFWETGKVSGTMYCGDHDHYEFLTEAFGKFAHVNALQRDLCPSATRFEGEVVAMVLDLMHGDAVTDGEPGGMLTSGGTGSILHAVLAYREDARARGVTRPNLVKPETAHPAFDKACHLFGIELRRAPVDPETTLVDVDWVRANIDDQTIGFMGSACNYGYGTIDPIVTMFEGDRAYPLPQKALIHKQLPVLKKRFLHSEEWGAASIQEVFDEKQLESAQKLDARMLETCWFENQNGHFVAHPLHFEAQIAPTNAIIFADFTGDGLPDLLLAGNKYGIEVETNRLDAGNGVLLKGDGHGHFSFIENRNSGFWAQKEVRDMAILTGPGKKRRIVVANNQAAPQIFEVKK